MYMLILCIQCDQAFPSCQQCEKFGYECQYRDLFDIFHKDQTSLARENAQTKWRKRSTKFGGQSSSEDDDHSNSETSVRSTPSFPLTGFLQLALEDRAISRFYFDFVDLKFPFLEVLTPRPSTARKTDSFLQCTVSAVSYANFAGRFNDRQAARAGAMEYGKAMRKLATTMDDPALFKSAEVCLSVYLLCLYETMAGDTLDGTLQAHLRGCGVVLSMYNPSTIKSSAERMLYSTMYAQQVSLSPFFLFLPEITNISRSF